MLFLIPTFAATVLRLEEHSYRISPRGCFTCSCCCCDQSLCGGFCSHCCSNSAEQLVKNWLTDKLQRMEMVDSHTTCYANEEMLISNFTNGFQRIVSHMYILIFHIFQFNAFIQRIVLKKNRSSGLR